MVVSYSGDTLPRRINKVATGDCEVAELHNINQMTDTASKAPAYLAVVGAVMVGALLSSLVRSPATPQAKVDVPVTRSTAGLPLSPEVLDAVLPPTEWKAQTVPVASIKLRFEFPTNAKSSGCRMPGAGDAQVTVCDFSGVDKANVAVRLMVVSEGLRFIPMSWYESAMNGAVSSVDNVQLTQQLQEQLQSAVGVSVDQATTLPRDEFSGALSLKGVAKSVEIGGQTLHNATCIIAFSLASNRPVEVIFCSESSDSETTRKDASRLLASIRKLNASSEYAKNSYRKLEEKLYAAVMAKSSPADKMFIEESEQTYARQQSAECEGLSVLSQERYTCVEQHAKARAEILSTLSADISAAFKGQPQSAAPKSETGQ